MEILRHKMRTEVKTVLRVYTFLGASLAIVELITVVLACVYVVQINRRDRKQKYNSSMTRDGLGNKNSNEPEQFPVWMKIMKAGILAFVPVTMISFIAIVIWLKYML